VLSEQGLEYLRGQGISASAYAALQTVYFAIIMVVWCVIAFLIFWRRSDDVIALVIALVGAYIFVAVGLNGLNTFSYALGLACPALATAMTVFPRAAHLASIVFFVYFPSARSSPRWMLLMVALGVAMAPVNLHSTSIPGWLFASIYFAFYGGVIVAQVYRYQQISTPSTRQQTTWMGVAITIATVAASGLLLLSAASPLLPVGNAPFVLGEVWTSVFSLVSLAIPITVGVAILRYQLLDIGKLINKALVYGILSAILATVFVGVVIGLQSLARTPTGQGSPVALVATTVLIAGLAQPLRSRIHQALADLGATLRQEVSLTERHAHLLAFVGQTMQPASLSVWRAPGRAPESVQAAAVAPIE